jgi:hypothetical protein
MEDTVGELLQRAPGDVVAMKTNSKEYSEEVLYTTCHKTANLLNHLGAREGGDVVVSPAAVPENVFGFLGACLVGAETRFVEDGEIDADVLVCDGTRVNAYDVPASCRVIAHGDAEGRVTDFDREIWGENPVFPPDLVAGADAVVLDGKTSSEVVERARGIVDDRGLWNGDEITVGSLNGDGAVKVVAAVVARASVVLCSDSTDAR